MCGSISFLLTGLNLSGPTNQHVAAIALVPSLGPQERSPSCLPGIDTNRMDEK